MPANQGCAQIFEKKKPFQIFFLGRSQLFLFFFENRNFVIMRIARKKKSILVRIILNYNI